MRHIIFKDSKIENIKAWKKEDTAFWKEHLGITPTYEVIDIDFSDYPTYVDEDGDIRPTAQYLQKLTDMAVRKYGEFGFDFLIVLVHEDNWKSDTDTTKGIWGTNYSYVFGKQCLEYCRWDKDNSANTFGTIYHERHHSFDALIKVELGINIEPILNVFRYDAEITHGGSQPWKYIRHKENLDSLRLMKPYLLQAFQKRRERHEEDLMGMQRTIIKLATQVLYLLRAKMNRKNGVPRN